MPTTTLLHKDKDMRLAKTDQDSQPIQLDLFQKLISDNYSNSFHLYKSLNDIYTWDQSKLRNEDWTLPVLTRQGRYKGVPLTLDISPANITIENKTTKKKTKQAFYKTILCGFIEEALQKLSIEDGFFITKDNVETQEFALITTFYQIRAELKRAGKNYSYEQIRQWISILAWLRYELSWDISKNYGLESYFSPIDLIIKNDKKNPLHSELYITFNKLVSKKVLALEWRAFNYIEYMKVKSHFGRRLFMRLSHKHKNADALGSYHFKLTTLIKDWDLLDDSVNANIKKIDEGIKDCKYIIDHCTTTKTYGINPKTNRQVVIDYVVSIFTTKEFQQEQWRINTQQKAIQNYRIAEDWKAVIKPLRDQYKTAADYDRFIDDSDKYENAKQPSNK